MESKSSRPIICDILHSSVAHQVHSIATNGFNYILLHIETVTVRGEDAIFFYLTVLHITACSINTIKQKPYMETV